MISKRNRQMHLLTGAVILAIFSLAACTTPTTSGPPSTPEDPGNQSSAVCFYDNALAPAVSDWSWGTSIEQKMFSPNSFDGTPYLQAEYLNGYPNIGYNGQAGISFNTSTPVMITRDTIVSFAINPGPDASEGYRLMLYGNDPSAAAEVRVILPRLDARTWETIEINAVDEGLAVGTQLSRIAIEPDRTGSVLLDSIEVRSSGQDTACEPPSEELLLGLDVAAQVGVSGVLVEEPTTIDNKPATVFTVGESTEQYGFISAEDQVDAFLIEILTDGSDGLGTTSTHDVRFHVLNGQGQVVDSFMLGDLIIEDLNADLLYTELNPQGVPVLVGGVLLGVLIRKAIQIAVRYAIQEAASYACSELISHTEQEMGWNIPSYLEWPICREVRKRVR